MVYNHLATFCDDNYCSSRDIIFLVCHLIKQDHKILGSDVYDRPLSHNLTTFGSHRHCGIWVIVFLVFLQDHVMKGSSDFIGKSI